MTTAKIEFKLLGPVTVLANDIPVQLGGRLPKELLAALLLRHGQPADASFLIDALWGDDPPSTAVGRIQTMVSILRRTMAEAGVGQETITTCAAGYAVNPASGSLDLDIFRAAVAAGRKAAHHPKEALTHFRLAIGLWNGCALAGLKGPFAVAQGTRLEGLRLDAVEELAAAHLAVDAPKAALIDELTALTIEHPGREALIGYLMTALHQVGRTVDALRVYQDCRDWLCDRLGINPSRQLRNLHTAILRDSPTLLSVASAVHGTQAGFAVLRSAAQSA